MFVFDTASLLPQRDVRTGVIDLQCFLSSGGVSPLVVRPGHLHLRRLALRFRGCRPGPLTPGATDMFDFIFDYDFDAITCGLCDLCPLTMRK